VASGFEMRVGDVERDAAATELREHFATGRLTQDELSERLDQAFAAKTRGDLSGLFTDLPSTTSWQNASAGGERSTAGAPFGDSRPFGASRPFGINGPSGSSGPFGDGGAGGAGRRGGYARQAFGTFVVPFVLLWALLLLGFFAIFGMAGGRPFGIVLLFAAFAVLRRLLFVIFGWRRGGRGGPRRGGRGGSRRGRC
jgi:Domain of unknown function (DUF1707)